MLRLSSQTFQQLFDALETATTHGEGVEALNKFLVGCPIAPEGLQRVVDVAHRYIERLPPEN
jgi:hypothetical protein